MKATLSNFRQPPRRVRLVAGLIRGKKLSQALAELDFVPKKSADPIKRLLLSAAANAENNHQLSREDLYITEIRVDKGVVMKRSQPRSHGMATPIHKRSSHIVVTLGPKPEKKGKKAKKEVAITEKAVAPKKSTEKKVAAKKPAEKKVAKKTVKKAAKK